MTNIGVIIFQKALQYLGTLGMYAYSMYRCDINRIFKGNFAWWKGISRTGNFPSREVLERWQDRHKSPTFYCLIGNLFEVYHPEGVGIEKRNMNDDCLSNVIFMCLMSVSMLPIAGLAFPLIVRAHLPSPMSVGANFWISQMRKLLGGTCTLTYNLSPIPNSPI